MNERTIMQELNDHPFVVKLHYAFQSVSRKLIQNQAGQYIFSSDISNSYQLLQTIYRFIHSN